MTSSQEAFRIIDRLVKEEIPVRAWFAGNTVLRSSLFGKVTSLSKELGLVVTGDSKEDFLMIKADPACKFVAGDDKDMPEELRSSFVQKYKSALSIVFPTGERLTILELI